MARAIQVTHHLAGRKHHSARTRFRVPRRAVRRVADQIHSLPDVTKVEVNEATGSILVRHKDHLGDLIATLEAQGIADMVGVPEASSILASLGPKVLTLGLVTVLFAIGAPRWIASQL